MFAGAPVACGGGPTLPDPAPALETTIATRYGVAGFPAGAAIE